MVDVPQSDLPQDLRSPSLSGQPVPDSDLPMGLKNQNSAGKTFPPPKENPAFSGSFGNVTMNAPRRDILKDAGAFAYGLGTSTLGNLGDFGLRIPGSVTGLPFSTPLPKTEQIRGALPKSLTPGAGEEAFTKAGEYAPLAVGGANLAESGLRGAPKLAETLGTRLGALTGAESAARTARLAESAASGRMGKNILSRATKAAQRRSDVADRLYDVAKDRMDAKFARGDVWQTSPSGKAFFKDLAAQLDTSKATKVTSDTRKIITDLVRELLGTPREDGSIAPATPQVLRTTLRELRDAAAGDPKEGFKALGQQEAGDLANKLSASIGEWEPSLQSADVQYRAHTKALYPEGVTPGKFSKEKRTAEKTINLLENRLKQGTLKPEEVSKKIRATLNSPQVTRLVSQDDARQINAELDAIDAIKGREEKARAIAKMAAKYLGAGALLGAGAEIFREVL